MPELPEMKGQLRKLEAASVDEHRRESVRPKGSVAMQAILTYVESKRRTMKFSRMDDAQALYN